MVSYQKNVPFQFKQPQNPSGIKFSDLKSGEDWYNALMQQSDAPNGITPILKALFEAENCYTMLKFQKEPAYIRSWRPCFQRVHGRPWKKRTDETIMSLFDGVNELLRPYYKDSSPLSGADFTVMADQAAVRALPKNVDSNET